MCYTQTDQSHEIQHHELLLANYIESHEDLIGRIIRFLNICSIFQRFDEIFIKFLTTFAKRYRHLQGTIVSESIPGEGGTRAERGRNES